MFDQSEPMVIIHVLERDSAIIAQYSPCQSPEQSILEIEPCISVISLGELDLNRSTSHAFINEQQPRE